MHLDVTDTIEAVRAKYDAKLEAGEETEHGRHCWPRAVPAQRWAACASMQLSAGDGTKIQGMISKEGD